ncbi:CAP domain-containing protein [Streptomyces sp. NPDC015171]|uniref:CAP domain-containing protein n=1 Tax=Streptomyces sp. NPDC015171 TaxID=3364945 RepID=UPI0036F9A76B
MGQHRKTKHYRRIVITAVAIGAVGVPSVALACSDWPYGTENPSQAAAASAPLALPSAPVEQWQQIYRQARHSVPGTGTAPSSTPSSAPATPPATAHPTAKKKPTADRPRRTTAAIAPGAPRPSTPKPAATTAASAPAAPSTPKSASAASGVTGQILRLVNDERSKAGCQPLTLNGKLSQAAQAHSADMASHRNMSHTGSDGSSPGDRITGAGYAWSSYGENVAYGYTTADQVMAGWMSSPGHRANILNCGFKEIGIGLAQPGSYWTQDFGSAR